jgi:hypothetical protein
MAFVPAVEGTAVESGVRRSSEASGISHNAKEAIMAQYAILIYEAESGYAEGGQEAWEQGMQAHSRFAGQVGERGGKIVGGDALEPTTTATSIRGDIVTDGPFAETKEALGGFYLIEARDLDHAIEIAKLCPAPFGGVEVRPIMDTSGA